MNISFAYLKPAISLSLLLLVSFFTASAENRIVAQLESPNHQTKIQFGLNGLGQVIYQMNFKGHTVTNWSVLGLETDGPELAKGITIDGRVKRNNKETFDWALGENAQIENNYRELILQCRSTNATFDVVARAFNGSLAIRYAVRRLKQPLRLKKELTEFNLAGNYKIYQYHEESIFRPVKLDDMPGICDFPATLVSNNKLYLTIGEAENRNGTKCVLIKGSKPNSLALDFYTDTIYRNNQVQAVHKDTLITFKDSLVTPWRTISCAESAIGLHDFSQLNLKLVTPLSRENPLYVKPGKVFRVPISTQGGMDGADFAAKMNFQYILLDAGWYGAEFRGTSDPTKWIPELDLPKIIAHAKTKGIGVILYVNYVGLKAKLDTILPLYKKWGVSGMKFGFVDGGTQKGLSWLDSAMQKVNDYGFILNIHDHYKPTGLSRRYPYNLSQEGVRGDENSPDAFHIMTLPYTRYLAGPADFTFCYPNPLNTFSKNLKVSKGQQLALTVVYFDPLQAIFWYGKSQDYQVDSPEIEFFKYVPTVWDESHYLQGEIGESVSVARRKGNNWYIGTAAGFNSWATTIKLDFLKKRQFYTATIYGDDEKGGIGIHTIKVKNGDVIPVNLAAKSGQAIILRQVE
ncbi:glycoside hydrolase family 97 catalytic domain-containing protein [Mucilaginibacter sp.]|jgi:alpha-glucosidase|uniref:glycoside hydrolase family 97 protein n=1 Tax=Mucilaginibacter sp. TaxID=1882438 RepID=UPI0035622264